MFPVIAFIGVGLAAIAGDRPGVGRIDRDIDRRVEVDGNSASPISRAAVMGDVSDGCDGRPPERWFGSLRALPGCLDPSGKFADWPAMHVRAADVDRDGTLEHCYRPGNGYSFAIITGGSPAPDASILSRVAVQPGEGAESIAFVEILDVEHVSQSFLAAGGSAQEVSLDNIHGWVDMDGDRDLDLIIVLRVDGKYGYFWLENTGFEATQPLTGDLDSDGDVDPADLTMLLGGWTGS